MQVRPEGLYCHPADAYIDPRGAQARAIITHGHADHARAGHNVCYATEQTMRIMQVRYGEQHALEQVGLAYHQRIDLGEVTLWFAPAGHILGSAQVVLEYRGSRIVISGDYKRRYDPTCATFEVVPCDVFVTEATFGLPVFCHPPIEEQLHTLLASLKLFPNRCHVIGAYALGKCQRIMVTLRQMGYDEVMYLHGAQVKLCELYEREGISLGAWQKASDVKDKSLLAGKIVLAPPSALADSWSRKLPDVLTCMASGWVQIRARAKQRRAELPLIISDHADWNELCQTIQDVSAKEIWITHGREDALMYQVHKMGINAQALSLLGYEDEETG
jgi:putative mRNA 3-end processing factor